MPLWKRLVLVSASFGAGLAITAAAILGLLNWYHSRPQAWNTSALKASFATVEILTQPSKDSYVAEFLYDLQNNTEKNYQISVDNITVMANLTEGKVLSKEFGHYQTSDVTIEGPDFIPPQGKARITLRISYQYPSEFTEGDKDNIGKVGSSFDYRLKELDGFVLFDKKKHYRIDLPEGWKNWDRVKSK